MAKYKVKYCAEVVRSQEKAYKELNVSFLKGIFNLH